MPRNLRGGKAFKKGKKAKPAGEGGESHVQRFEEPDRSQGVDYARVLRALGNRRMLCFCNDGAERVCKIRGALCKGPKRQKIEIGDIVLVSYRAYMTADSDSDDDGSEEEEEVAATTVHRNGGGSAAASEMAPTVGAATLDSGRKDIGDIVFKYDSRNWRIIRKQSGIHAHLFGDAAAGGGSALDDDIFHVADEEEDDGKGDNKAEAEKNSEDGEMDDSDIDAI